MWSGPSRFDSGAPQPRGSLLEDAGDWLQKYWIWTVAAAVVLAGGFFLWTRYSLHRQMQHGLQAYEAGNYAAAVQDFTAVVESHPDSMDARLYLARALTGQYVAGGDSPENGQLARGAHDELGRVLTRNPDNRTAVESLAALYYKEGKFDEARAWYRKSLAAQPDRSEDWCRLGLIVRAEFLPVRLSRRADRGMAPEDAGPLPMPDRAELKAKWLPAIEEGIQNLQKALDLDRTNDEAMTGLNLLLRERADLADDASQYERDLQAASEWADRAAETRRSKLAPGGGK